MAGKSSRECYNVGRLQNILPSSSSLPLLPPSQGTFYDPLVLLPSLLLQCGSVSSFFVRRGVAIFHLPPPLPFLPTVWCVEEEERQLANLMTFPRCHRDPQRRAAIFVFVVVVVPINKGPLISFQMSSEKGQYKVPILTLRLETATSSTPTSFHVSTL